MQLQSVVNDISHRMISINAPHAGCNHVLRRQRTDPAEISINAPHAGCNQQDMVQKSHLLEFQSTHPMRGATDSAQLLGQLPVISINAPHAGCNSKTIQFKCVLAARRMYNFANYVLHILKHQHTYCIGITL